MSNKTKGWLMLAPIIALVGYIYISLFGWFAPVAIILIVLLTLYVYKAVGFLTHK